AREAGARPRDPEARLAPARRFPPAVSEARRAAARPGGGDARDGDRRLLRLAGPLGAGRRHRGRLHGPRGRGPLHRRGVPRAPLGEILMRAPRAALADKGWGEEPGFHWRGGEISRLEGFSDTVFAFAVTLL